MKRLALVIALPVRSTPCLADTFSGELFRTPDGLMIDGALLPPTIAKRVTRTCDIGSDCTVEGSTDHCLHVQGACLMLMTLASVRRGAH